MCDSSILLGRIGPGPWKQSDVFFFFYGKLDFVEIYYAVMSKGYTGFRSIPYF